MRPQPCERHNFSHRPIAPLDWPGSPRHASGHAKLMLGWDVGLGRRRTKPPRRPCGVGQELGLVNRTGSDPFVTSVGINCTWQARLQGCGVYRYMLYQMITRDVRKWPQMSPPACLATFVISGRSLGLPAVTEKWNPRRSTNSGQAAEPPLSTPVTARGSSWATRIGS